MSKDEMSLREYKAYAKKKHGEKTLNESMLRTMEQASESSGGKSKMPRGEWDRMNGKIKMEQARKQR